jgi:hypothetical protein
MTAFEFLSTKSVDIFVRVVCSVSTFDLTGGWGLFEDKGFRANLAMTAGVSLLALHFMTHHLIDFRLSPVLGHLLPVYL